MTSGGASRFTFLEQIGKGAFGAVWLVEVEVGGLMQRLALKVLDRTAAENPDLIARQEDEARLLAQLHHDHIVRVVELTKVDGSPAVLMEFIDGASASQILKVRRFPARAALEALASVAGALHAAYTTTSSETGRPLRVIHRDVKPSNMLVSGNGVLKVVDFGIARADLARAAHTATSIQLGTMRYMAPEQWLRGDVSPRVDIYALGVSFFEMLYGTAMTRLPLERDVFDEQVERCVQGLSSVSWTDDFTLELQDLLRRMMSYEAQGRPGAREVEAKARALAERAPGASLLRFARHVVPLVQEKRRMKAAQVLVRPDLPPADRVPSPAPERDILPDVVLLEPDRRSPPWWLGMLVGAAVTGAVALMMRPAPEPPGEEVVSTLRAVPVEVADAEVAPAPVPEVEVPAEVPVESPEPVLVASLAPPVERTPGPRTDAAPRKEVPPPPPVAATSISVPVGLGDEVTIGADDVLQAVRSGEQTTIYTRQGKEVVSYWTITDLMRRLPTGRFLQVHARALVRVDTVDALEQEPAGSWIARTALGTVPVADHKVEELKGLAGLRDDGTR